MAPFDLMSLIGKPATYAIYVLVGMGFGAVLEMSGFAISTKLTGQFYLRDQTVFKVMFSGVIVAMVLIFGASALGLLDYNRIWVPLTYLWPGIVGGFLIGVGFIIGGFCPGTSIVGAATGKIDAFFFIGGILAGIILFGETKSGSTQFFHSSYLDRFTLPQWLGAPSGVVVFVTVVVAIFLIWGAEKLERAVRGETQEPAPSNARFIGAGILAVAALGVMLVGEPTEEQRWQRVADVQGPRLEQRLVQIHPAELRSLYYNPQVKLVMLDLRSEVDYNLYHLNGAKRVAPADVAGLAPELLALPAETVVVLMSNDEALATIAWRQLIVREVRNAYILEGGVNGWLAAYSGGMYPPAPEGDAETLRYRFDVALGSAAPTATPPSRDTGIEFSPKVELQRKAPVGGGGCG